MTREQLEGYKSKKEEIAELEYKLKHLSEDSIDNYIILDYRKGYPQPQAIVGVDMNKYDNARARYTTRIVKLRAEWDEI